MDIWPSVAFVLLLEAVGDGQGIGRQMLRHTLRHRGMLAGAACRFEQQAAERPQALQFGCLAAHGVLLPILQLGLPDRFIEHGDPAKLLSLCGLDAAGIEQSIRQRFFGRPQLAAANG